MNETVIPVHCVTLYGICQVRNSTERVMETVRVALV